MHHHYKPTYIYTYIVEPWISFNDLLLEIKIIRTLVDYTIGLKFLAYSTSMFWTEHWWRHSGKLIKSYDKAFVSGNLANWILRFRSCFVWLLVFTCVANAKADLGVISKERSCNFEPFLFYKSSEIPYHFRDILRCNFRGRPHNSLMGSFSKKKKWKVHNVRKIILSNFCSLMHFKILVVFEI